MKPERSKEHVRGFFRTIGPEFIHMVEADNSISGAYYKVNCLEPLFDNIRRRRLKSDLHGIKLHHDNAKPHQTKSIKEFLQLQGVITMPHPSYSPDLARSDFWFFSYLKRQLDGYSDSESLQQAVTKTLLDIPHDEFRKIFNKWIERMELCITNQGNYFEHSVNGVFCKLHSLNKRDVLRTFGSPYVSPER